jgi:23S rRNA (pseudouridine1915-N3)-methyltransferase
LRLLAIGRIGQTPEAEIFARYNARLRPPFEITELPEGRGSPAEIKRREAASLRAALPTQFFAIALDLGAPAPTSELLATRLQQWREVGRPLAFIIGGAEGLDSSILARANATLSLGPLTWPHMLVRVMLAEQIFRANCIVSGHPYHRSGRP